MLKKEVLCKSLIFRNATMSLKKGIPFLSPELPLSSSGLLSYPQSYIILFFIFNFKFKYDEYDILLKQLIHFCFNICLKGY